VNPRLDARVHDDEVLNEIELYGELIIAASDSDGPLSEAQIDAILGVRHEEATGPAVLAEAAANPARSTTARSTAAVRGAHSVPPSLRRRSAS
jgi:hypothetical protein